MADLSGFTAMTEVHGAGMAAEMIKKYVGIVESSLKGESFMLERVGDQVVVISPNPDDLAYTATEIRKRTENEKNFLSIHAGLHYGEVLELEGHYYGSAMNLTARIAAKAKHGKILCSQDFIDALSDTESFQYKFHGNFQFKNVFETKAVIELLPGKARTEKKFMCPVCHMQLDTAFIATRHTVDDINYYFCSEDCRELFVRYELHNVSLAV